MNIFGEARCHERMPWPEKHDALVRIYAGKMPETLDEARERAINEPILAYAVKTDSSEACTGKVMCNYYLEKGWAMISSQMLLFVTSAHAPRFRNMNGITLDKPELIEGSDITVSCFNISI